MLGRKDFKPKLFHTIGLEDLVPQDHELRQILQLIDFGVIRLRVVDKYSHLGQPGIDPVVMIKMLFLGYYYGISSERKLAKEIIINTAYRWFLGYDLDETTPTHSVLSKGRSRYGLEVFQSLFDHIVNQCVEKGLVGGQKAFLDATLIEANASKSSLVPRLQIMTPKEYTEHMMPEEAPSVSESKTPDKPSDTTGKSEKVNEKMVSKTDPDASFIKYGKNKGLNYQGHYLVDGKNRVIVAVETTDTIDNASRYAPALLQKGFFRHGLKFNSVCADAEYGTQSFYQFLFANDMLPYIPHAKGGNDKSRAHFAKEDFSYDDQTDSYRCPAGKELKYTSQDQKKKMMTYSAECHDCLVCPLREQCTTSPQGRKLKRLFYEEAVEQAKQLMETAAYRQHMKARKVTVEPMFSEAKGSHGMKRAKYRRKWRVSIQVLWTATVQNIKRLMKATHRPPKAIMVVNEWPMSQILQTVFLKMISLFNCQRSSCCF